MTEEEETRCSKRRVFCRSASTFNETPIISIVVSIVSAISLDASLGYAAMLMNRCTSTSSPAVRSRCRVLVGLLIAVFAIAYAGLILLAWSDASRADTDLVTSGTLTRLLLPTATSILSFVMGLALNPNDDRLSEINSQLAELNRELDATTATAQRLQTAFHLYDPAQYDLQQYKLAVARLKAQRLAAEHEVRLMLAQELGTANVTNQLLPNLNAMPELSLSLTPNSLLLQRSRSSMNRARTRTKKKSSHKPIPKTWLPKHTTKRGGNMKIKNMLAVLLISGIFLLSLCGCSAEQTVEPMNIAVVTLNGKNIPQYDKTAMDNLINQAVASDINSTVSLVIADGEPHLAWETICFSTKEARNGDH